MIKSKTKIKSRPKKAIKELNKLNKRMEGRGGIVVGLPKNSNNYPDGTSVIKVGITHEFGDADRNIPQRSYLRSTMAAERKPYKNTFKKLAEKIVKGKLTKEKALGLLGLKVQTDVREKITTLDSPKLKSRSGNPLVDTGHLRQSIVFEVR